MNVFQQLRKENNLTQSKLAEKLNIKQNTVSRWEKNISLPDYTTLIALADLYNVTTDYLLGREDEFGIIKQKKDIPGNAKVLTEEQEELLDLFENLNMYSREAILIQMRALAKDFAKIKLKENEKQITKF